LYQITGASRTPDQGLRPQIPVFSVLCAQLILLKHTPPKKFLDTSLPLRKKLQKVVSTVDQVNTCRILATGKADNFRAAQNRYVNVRQKL